ncbi:MAG: hypothetical protein ACOCUA_03040 [archaeon]
MRELEKLTLKLDSDGDGTTDLEYTVSMIDTVDITSRKDAFSIAPPGLAARDNILLGVSGMQADISVNFNVHDNGEDKANGTHSEEVVTVEEQILYLEREMQAPDFAAAWELDHQTGGAFDDDDVFLESVDVTPISADNRKWKPATLRLRRGSSVG